MTNILHIIGRKKSLFDNDLQNLNIELSNIVSQSRFLVIGGAGSIGQAVTKEIFKRSPEILHVVDINENNLTELVRDLRSSYGYIKGNFKVFALDSASLEFDVLLENNNQQYDYVLNLSALKHVRSEEDPHTLMRMINVNILNIDRSIKQAVEFGAKKYFCVSSDKAANPVNMMGASKRIMEMFLVRHSHKIQISTARFANVAFSDGSLLHGFNQRMEKKQPIAAPMDVLRYFVTPQESGQLCLLSCIFGNNLEILFPKLTEELSLTNFADIAVRFIKSKGFQPFECATEEDARELVATLPENGKWPYILTKSDTTGEKPHEEFFTATEVLDLDKFWNLGIIKSNWEYDRIALTNFEDSINLMKSNRSWTKSDIVDEFKKLIPEFSYYDHGKYLSGKM